MITIVCQKCATAVRISGDPEEMEAMFGQFDKYKCPSCDGLAEEMDAIESAALQALDVHDLTPPEAYAAFHGLGFPDEQDCGPVHVNLLLKGKKITGVKADLIKGANRSVLYWIEFEDGTKMHLGSSPYGATVYRIQKPHSYAEQVLREG